MIRFEALAVILLHAAILWGFGIPFPTYLAVYFGFGFSWSAMQYVHHYGTDRHVARGARNLWISAPLDWLLLNHNWHLTHHKQPTVPWLYLPALGQAQDPERTFLLTHYLRMWRGPRHSSEHVENAFRGRVVK